MEEDVRFLPVVESGGGEKWWWILIIGGEWWRLSFFCGEKLGKSGFFREKNIQKMGILGLFFCDSCITRWSIVARSGR